MAHYLIGWVKCATNEKILGFISLVHHLSHLNHLNTQPIHLTWAHGFGIRNGPRIIYLHTKPTKGPLGTVLG